MESYQVDQAVQEAEALIDQGKWKEATETLQECKSKCEQEYYGTPMDAYWNACLKLGRVLFLQNEFEKASKSYADALKYLYTYSKVPDFAVKERVNQLTIATMMLLGACSEWFLKFPYLEAYKKFYRDSEIYPNPIRANNLFEKIVHEGQELAIKLKD